MYSVFNIRGPLRFGVACVFAVLSVTGAIAQELQRIEPVRATNPLHADLRYVEPSATRILGPDEYIHFKLFGATGEWFIQKLTERTYMFVSFVFAQTVFVGDEGVLVIDAPQSLHPERFFEALARVTDLPVTTLVYSHPHVDHTAGAKQLRDALRAQGRRLRIVASENCAREIRHYKNGSLYPTDIIANGRARFRFEKWSFQHVTPVHWAHTGADSYTITPDGVAHLVDFAKPGKLPLADVSGVQNMRGFIDIQRYLLGEQWMFYNPGHLSIGYRSDVERTLAYFEDLYNLTFDYVATQWSEEAMKARVEPAIAPDGSENEAVIVRNYFDEITQHVAAKAALKWGQWQQFEVARDHVRPVAWDVFLNWDFTRHPEVRPDFGPIPNTQRTELD